MHLPSNCQSQGDDPVSEVIFITFKWSYFYLNDLVIGGREGNLENVRFWTVTASQEYYIGKW